MVSLRNKIVKPAISVMIFASLFSNLPQNAFAGTFTHVHTSACDKTVEKTCTHFLRYGKEHMEKLCPNCGTVTHFRMDT